MSDLSELFEETRQLLLSARVEWALVALALYVMAWLAASGRWRLVVAALGGRLGWLPAGLATIAGVAVNNLTPTGRLGGEACRIAITRLKGDLTLSRGALATICDRATDAPLIALIALVALPALPALTGGYVRGAAIATAVVLAFWLLFGQWVRRLLRSWVSGWLREGLAIDRRTIAAGFAFSALVWVEDVLRLMAVARAFEVVLTPSQGAALVLAGLVGGFVPTIGGLGAVEGALAGLLVLFGLPIETAIAITTLERAISYGFSTVLGGIVVLAFGGRRLWAPARRRESAPPQGESGA
jgi:uncharacterized membrane protein YbhN (UPF0104 family)